MGIGFLFFQRTKKINDSLYELGEGHEYVVELDEIEVRLTNAKDLNIVFDQLETLESADLWVTIDRGFRTSWLRRLLGLTDRDILPCFYLVKEGDFAAITFLDENWSEYRVLDPEQTDYASKEIRLRIAMSQGEWNPLEAKYALRFSRALEAIRHFANNASRPDWLSYQYVR